MTAALVSAVPEAFGGHVNDGLLAGWRGRCGGGSRLVGLRMSRRCRSWSRVMGALTRSWDRARWVSGGLDAARWVVHLDRPVDVDPGGDVVRAVKAAKEEWLEPS